MVREPDVRDDHGAIKFHPIERLGGVGDDAREYLELGIRGGSAWEGHHATAFGGTLSGSFQRIAFLLNGSSSPGPG